MGLATLQTAVLKVEPGAKPKDEDLDLFGLTHPGKVRKENQDHFLLCTVHPTAVVHATNLGIVDAQPLRGERLATVMVVADGVGSGTAGGAASALATETITRYVTNSLRCYHATGNAGDAEFITELKAAALEAHDAVRAEAATRTPEPGRKQRSMATTLTLAIAVWPHLYVVQVGDSRAYLFWDGTLHQITRDQTVAQDLVDQGVLPKDRQAASQFSSVLSSAIGGSEASPDVSHVDLRQGCVLLLCSDGLTKHVADEEIQARITTMESSEQLCRGLLDLALERGGTDNITVLAGRARKLPPA